MPENSDVTGQFIEKYLDIEFLYCLNQPTPVTPKQISQRTGASIRTVKRRLECLHYQDYVILIREKGKLYYKKR